VGKKRKDGERSRDDVETLRQQWPDRNQRRRLSGAHSSPSLLCLPQEANNYEVREQNLPGEELLPDKRRGGEEAPQSEDDQRWRRVCQSEIPVGHLAAGQ